MTELNNKLIDLINKNHTINEITRELKITHKQLYYRLFLLKNEGINIKNKYYSNAETVLEPIGFKDVISNENTYNSVDLITQKSNNALKTMIISDIHKCNNSQDSYCLEIIYNYCKNNNINIILNCGDLIEGMGSMGGNPTTSDICEQIDRFIKEYPFDSDILNLVVLGNHDAHPLLKNNQDFKTILENQRRDIIPIGYRQGIINVKDDRIILHHPIDNIPNDFQKSTVNLYGHSHKLDIKSNVNSLSIHVPSLSNIEYYKDRLCTPQALEATFKFNNKYISGVDLTHLMIIDKKPIIISETSMQLSNQRKNHHKEQFLEVTELPKTRKIQKK